MRGGGWNTVDINLRSTYRIAINAGSEIHNLGFRVASYELGGSVPTVSEWGLSLMALLILGQPMEMRGTILGPSF